MATTLLLKEKPGFLYIPPGFMHTLTHIILIILFISQVGYKAHSILPSAYLLFIFRGRGREGERKGKKH